MWDLQIGAQDPRVPGNLGFSRADSSSSSKASWLTPLSQCITRAEQMTSVQRLQADVLPRPPASGAPPSMEHHAYFYDHNVLFVLFDQPVTVAVIR